MNIEITEEKVHRILDILSHGLTKGLGEQKEGQMCVEAAICFAFNLPHNDNPPCVGSEVRKAKIALNDCDWSSNQARAEGMKYLAIAQLGSDVLNQEEFFNKLKLNSFKKILPCIIQKHFDKTKDDKLLAYKAKFENLIELDEALWKEFYNNNYNYNYYNYNYNYYNYNHYNFGDEFLFLIADTILQTLKEMNSPGCKFLHLIK